MTDSMKRTCRPATKAVSKGQFIVDRAYIREQAREAVLTFVAPFTGVYRAVTGQSASSRRAASSPGHGTGSALKRYSKIRDQRKKAKSVSISHL